MTRFRLSGSILPLLVLAGCNATEQPVIRPLPALPGGLQAAPPRLNGDIGSTEPALAAQVSYGRGRTPAVRTANAASTGGATMLDFADTDVRDAVAQILGSLLHVTYTVDPAVKGTVTLHTATPLDNSQLLPTLQVLLSQVGAELFRSGGIYRVVSVSNAAAAGPGQPGQAGGNANTPVLASGDGLGGSSMVALRYAGAEDLAKALQPFVQPGAKITAVAGANALLVTGDPAVRGTLLSLIQAFDIDALAGQSYALLPVDSGDAKDMATAVTEALHGRGNALKDVVKVVPMSRVDAVLVIASQPQFIDDARRLFGVIERTRRLTVRSWHVYYLQNSHANDAAYALQQAFTPNNVTAQPSSSPQASGLTGQSNSNGSGGGLGSTSGGIGGTLGSSSGLGSSGGLGGSLGSSGGIGGGLGGTSQSSTTPGGAPGSANTQAGANPLLGGLDSSGGGNTDANTMRIIPNPQNNALLIYATAQENDTVNQMLHKIDILPLQVRIDAVIAEVDLTGVLQYGTQFFFKSGGINGVLSSASGTVSTASIASAALSSSLPGFVIGGTGAGGAPVAINALQQVTTVHVLSSPELLVLDNQPARLQVGQLVPYQTGSSTSTVTSGSVYNQYSYQPTGVIMQVTPRVNNGGLVTLDISQEVSSLAGGTGSSAASTTSPTFNDQSVSSRIVVQDGQTVGLAGLIKDQSSRENTGIPWLKDIPVLGLLAGSQNNNRARTELLILITPHVMHDQRDAQALTEDLRDTLSNAAAVPYELGPMRQEGSADPQQRVRRAVGLGN